MANLGIAPHFGAIISIRCDSSKSLEHWGEIKRNLIRCSALIVLVKFLVTYNVLLGGPVTIQGEMNSLLFLGVSNPVSRTCQFKVRVDGCKFCIETLDTTRPTDYGSLPSPVSLQLPKKSSFTRITTNVWCFDGSNTYTAHFSGLGWSAYVRPGFTRQLSSTFYEVLWLAFASGCYISSLSNSSMVPVWVLDDPRLEAKAETNAYQMHVVVELVNDLWRLPSKIVYFNPDGYTNAVYEVLSLTNTRIGAFPRNSVFTRYDTSRGLTEPKPIVSINLIDVHNFDSELEEENFLPSCGNAQVLVTDYRLTGKVEIAPGKQIPYNYVRYYISNSLWPTAMELAEVRARHEAEIRGQHSVSQKASAGVTGLRNRATTIRLVFWGCVVLSLAAIWLAAVLKGRKPIKN